MSQVTHYRCATKGNALIREQHVFAPNPDGFLIPIVDVPLADPVTKYMVAFVGGALYDPPYDPLVYPLSIAVSAGVTLISDAAWEALALQNAQDVIDDSPLPPGSGGSGTNGLSVLNGTIDPTSGDGVDGEFWINTTTDEIFGPKVSGAWGAGTSLVGPDGADGPQGLQGNQGNDGLQGDPGIQGIQGDPGTPGGLNYSDTCKETIIDYHGPSHRNVQSKRDWFNCAYGFDPIDDDPRNP